MSHEIGDDDWILRFNQHTGGFRNGTRTKTVSKHPIPIKDRVPTEFLWQKEPFRLDGGMRPEHQPPGIDMALPYWFGRNYGMLP